MRLCHLPRPSHRSSRLPRHCPPRQPLPAGERRQVTVLYGTLAHTTALADQLGLEAFRPLMQMFHTLAQDCVQRYEGTVQTLGEAGVLALFGAPVAQEEHAWRAVQAALALQQRLREALPGRALLHGEALTARVGVHTGWVVAGSHRDEPPQAVVVGGDTTQGAMHLQALADPGTLLVSETTLRLLRSTVWSTVYGLVCVPGHPDPLMAYMVQGLEAPTATRVWSPFVGRQRELAVFDDLLAHALAGQGQVVGLIGEPGIGKSRLLAEFQQRLLERPVTVLAGHCRAYDRLLPYGPVRDLLLHQCGLSTTASLEVVATRVAQLLRAVDLPPEDSAPYLLQLLSGPSVGELLAQMTPDAIKDRTFATLRQGDLQQGIPMLERAFDLARVEHLRVLVPWGASLLGAAYALAGWTAEALPLLEQAVERGIAMGRQLNHALQVVWLSEAYLLAGRLDEAHTQAHRALEFSRAHQERGHEAYALRLLGEIHARHDPPEVEAAETHYHQASLWPRRWGCAPSRPTATRGWAGYTVRSAVVNRPALSCPPLSRCTVSWR
jgi:class 3 adenylate cyclase